MKKLISLIKASMTDNMDLFKMKTKNQTEISKKIFPIIIAVIFLAIIFSYANMIIETLVQFNLEYVVLTIFIGISSILTLIEGIYKSSNLLFNCKDDNLLLSLPIKKSTVLFIRVFKFYIFELLYNSLFLLPAMFAYSKYINVGATYYIVSFIALLLLPIIPIVSSCILGVIISEISSKFRLKNMAQTFITMLMLLIVVYASFNLKNIIGQVAENATTINDSITRLYYPAEAFIKLITDFNIIELIKFISIHVMLFITLIIVLSKIYFKINSKVKAVKVKAENSNYKIIINNPIKSIIKKEFKRFINSPVFVVNSGFGLILFIVGCIAIALKFESTVNAVIGQDIPFSMQQIRSYIPIFLFGLICFASLMSSITSSMISLEGKAFNILKSLPVKPIKIIFAKILTAVFIMLPFILIGDIIMFVRFKFNIFEITTILITSVILPLVAETIGIIINLKYPKMNAENDTEVVKQSMSSAISVFLGIILVIISIFIIFVCLMNNIQVDLIMLIGLGIYTALFVMLLFYLNKKGAKDFEMINI